MCESLKSVAIFSQNWAKVIGIIKTRQYVIKLIPMVKLGQKPPCRLFRCRRKEADARDFVRLGIDSTVQSKLLSMEPDHFLVDRKLIRSDLREWLYIGFVNPLMD
jgi:hypothetical protein